MRNLVSIFILLLLQLPGFGQTRTIRGSVFDMQSNLRIEGVKITPNILGDILSSEKGRFKVSFPKTYKDTIQFSHPDYYPHITKIKRSIPVHILLIPKSVGVDTVFQPGLEDCFILNGEVIDKTNHARLADASVFIYSDKLISKTNIEGKFAVHIPIDTDSIRVVKKEYAKMNVPIKKKHLKHLSMKIPLIRLSSDLYDSSWKIMRHAIQISPNEIFNLGLGLRYTFFIKNKLATGLHTTVYFQSLLKRNNPGNRYDGVKMAPFFKYYFYRNFDSGANFELKFIGGYFSSDKIKYHYDSYTTSYTDDFWSAGFSISIVQDWYIDSKVDLSLSLGLQLLPNRAPSTIEVNNIEYTRGDNSVFPLSNWYFAGSGSLFEIKFLIGGIF